MRKTIIICDRCGKEIPNDINGFPHYLNKIDLSLTYWHGGSVGGEEDVDRYNVDLCGDCARELASMIKHWHGNKKE